ncbi:MAG TPA: glucose-1-phosphate thymidylyltransferase, partial [Pilimelia sp.]|nr:glucose-1-phosphate thymidylyltransferase [Pilimelia sp.]
YFLTPAIHGAVDANRPSHRTETELSESVRWLIDRGEPVDAGEYSGYWRDVGTVDDVLACNRYLLSTQDGHLAGDVDDASELGPRVVVEAGARVVRSRIDGPAIIGPGALVVDSHLGPDTSIGRGCVLRGARLTGSVVLDAARITGAPPLRDSIIGRGAAIGRDPREGGHRLLVADHARVDLAA